MRDGEQILAINGQVLDDTVDNADAVRLLTDKDVIEMVVACSNGTNADNGAGLHSRERSDVSNDDRSASNTGDAASSKSVFDTVSQL